VGRRKDQGGVTVNGVYFSGWLYWHLNHWKIRIDDIDEYGNDIRIESYQNYVIMNGLELKH
jgi:hypothetical protein